MTAFRCLLFASVVAVGDALQQPTQVVGRETEGAFRAVTSKMDELHAGLAKIKADSLNAVSKQKADLDSKLELLLARNRDTESTNTRLAEDIRSLQEKNLGLRNESNELLEECKHITSELQVMQTNISMAQEFIEKSIKSSNLTDNPELAILADLDMKDASVEALKLHERSLSQMELLAKGPKVSMFQMGATEKNPGTQDLLNELLQSWDSIGGQQNGSSYALEEAFEKEKERHEKQYATLLKEQGDLNATKQAQESLNSKLQGAITHLKSSRDHLLQEKMALQKFAKRLGVKPVQGVVTPAPLSLELPSGPPEVPEATVEEETPENQQTNAGGVLGAATWLKQTLR